MIPHTLLKNIGYALVLFALGANAQAATTDLATAPLTPASTVMPNLMYILDDSGSMNWSYMPDDVLGFEGKYGYASSQCNGVYYNPRITYTLPVTSAGASYAAPSFTGAWINGYSTGAGTTNLSTSFRPTINSTTTTTYSTNNYGAGAASQPAFYFKYTGTQTSDDPQTKSRLQNYYDTGSTFYTECNTAVSGASSTATITITAASSASIARIKVNGTTDIMDGSSSSSSTTSTVASNIASEINSCTSWASGNCDVSGYSASVSGSTITISGPASAGDTLTVIMNSSSMTANAISMSSSNTYNNVATFAASSAPFTKVIVSSTSGDTVAGMPADERQNFANWYSYYRTRMNMMKSASGIAFQAIGSNVRVAYMTIDSTNPNFLNFAAFDASQKSSWYTKLYAASPSGSTPLREALARAGRIYAKKLTSLDGVTITDPVQYSCQKNFTLLSTDGFWNGNAGFKVDGTSAVGNQDGTEPRPQNDGSGTTYTKTTTQLQKTQTQVTKSTSQIQKTTTAYQTRTSNLQKQISQLQQSTSNLQKRIGTLQKRTYSGWSWSSWSNAGSGNNTATLTVSGDTSASASLDKIYVYTGGTNIIPNKVYGGSTANQLAADIAAAINQCTNAKTGGCTSLGYGGWGGTGTGFSATSSGNVVTITALTSDTFTLDPQWTAVTVTFTQFQSSGGGTCTWSSTTQCQYNWGSWSNVSSCNVSYSTNTTNGTTWSGNGTDCQYSAYTGATGVSTCTAVPPQSGPNYTQSTATQCATVITTPYANTTSDCTATTVPDGSGNTTQCQYGTWSSWSTVSASGSTATITLSGTSSTSFNQITVNGQKIMDNNTSSTTSSSTLAGYIATKINNCTSSRQGDCDQSGFSATVSGSVITITAPTSWGSISYTPSISKSGSMTATPTAFVAGVASCTAAAQSAGPTYTVHPARECSNNTTTVGVSSCTPSTGVTCATVTTGPSPEPCTAAAASSSNNYTATTCGTSVTVTGVPSCTASSGGGLTTTCATSTTTASVSSCTPATASSSNQYKTITCSAPTSSGGTSDTLADVAEYYYVTDLRTSTLGNCTSGSTTGNTLCVAGESQTDTKSYNNVKSRSDTDTANWQHMTTYTLGLGARGSMAYGESNYLSDSSGDFYSVLMGSTADSTATPPICSWLANGSTCNWPIPVSGTQTTIDDLWHAAVNGRGTYYSATDPAKLATALSDALNSITGIGHALAAPTLSNTNISDGDNFMFVSNFATDGWYSELVRRQLDTSNGAVKVDIDGKAINDWDAQARLDTNTSRTIYTYDSTNANGNKLKSFTYANLTGAEQAYFTAPNISTSPPSGTTGLTQYLCATTTTCLTATNKTNAAGNALVEYLRGARTNEGALNDNSKYYRMRSHLLGDIANSEAAYVKAPQFYYADAGYGAFKAAQAARQPMLYVGANDGMLHAFYAYGGDGSDGADPVQYVDTATGSVVTAAGAGIIQVAGGDEAWAYIPTTVMSKLFTLADKSYASKHQFFVDGTPVTADICVSNCTSNADAVWKTILVGGLNRGGKGYYALDITNPAAPKALWEFTDANLGYTYGKPVIVKLNDIDAAVGNTWAVLATSGHNNADGVGRLYVLNAATGAIIRTISTGVGSAATPSGLAQISAMAASSGNKENTVVQVYGGDLLGNVWRFDVNNRVGAAGYDAQLLATLSIGGTIQPITTKPDTGLVDSNVMVYVGTGKYLGNNNGVTPFGDAGNTDQQTMYAIRDPMLTTSTPATAVYSNLRTSGTGQTMTVTTCPADAVTAGICESGDVVRTGTNNAVNLSTQSGWYIDLPAGTGERINTDPLLVSGTLVFNTNTPQTTACSDGASYTYFLDYRSGAPILPAESPANAVIGKKIGNVGASRVVVFQLESTGKSYTTYEKTDGTTPLDNDELLKAPPGSQPAKRTSWRELISE